MTAWLQSCHTLAEGLTEQASRWRPQAPVLRTPYPRDHLSVISAITPDGRLVMHEQERALCVRDVVAFLRQVMRLIPVKLLAVWDGASIGRGQDVQASLAAGGATRLRLQHLPTYAPELIPDESLWQRFEQVGVRHRCCQDLACLASPYTADRRIRLAIRSLHSSVLTRAVELMQTPAAFWSWPASVDT